MNDLNLVGKMFITLALKLNTMVNLLWFLVIWKCCTSFKRQNKQNESFTLVHQPAIEEDDVASTSKAKSTMVKLDNNISTDASSGLSFPSLVKIGFLKLLKLNFISAATILFHLVHCEKIGPTLHLYRYGDQLCYTWWQYLISITLLPIVVLYPLSFGISLDMLKEGTISTNTFVLSCMMPLITFWFCLMKKMGQLPILERTEDEEKCVSEILDLEETLFVSDNKGMRWPIVQLYRNLLVVVIDTFVLSPVFKTLWFMAIFMSFLIHDWHRMPFKHPYLNHLQRLTSVSLFLVNLCSNPSSFSSIGNIMSVRNMGSCLTALRYTTIGLYILVPLSFPLWKVWMLYKRKQQRSL